MKRAFAILAAASVLIALLRAEDYDLVIYGGTSAAIIAAVQAKQMGKSVIIVSPDKHLGGLSAAGSVLPTRVTRQSSAGCRAISTIACGSTTTPTRPGSGRRNPNTAARDRARRRSMASSARCGSSSRSVAEKVFENYVKEFAIPLVRDEWLDRAKGVKKDGARITVDHDA